MNKEGIINTVYKENCSIFVEIHHAGVIGISENPMCPSAYEYKTPLKSVVGHEMTIELE